jgi:hypothetical protein
MSETPFSPPHALDRYDPHTSPTSASMRATLFRRVCGIFVAPVRTFTAIASISPMPPWADVLAVALLVAVGSTFAFTASDSGAWLIAERRAMFAALSGQHITGNQFAAMVVREQHGALLSAAFAGGWLTAFVVLIAAAGHAMLSSLSDQFYRLRYTHALSVAAHAALMPAVAIPCRLMLNLWRGSMGPSTSVSVLLPFLPNDSFLMHLGNAIDLFGLWWVYTLAIGFGIVYLRRPTGLRAMFIGIYLLAAVGQATLKWVAVAPSF